MCCLPTGHREPNVWPRRRSTRGALENGVYFIAVNRVGLERGVEFIGQSRICSPSGETIADALHRDEEIFYADIDVEWPRRKRIIRVPGKHAIDRLADRRPKCTAT